MRGLKDETLQSGTYPTDQSDNLLTTVQIKRFLPGRWMVRGEYGRCGWGWQKEPYRPYLGDEYTMEFSPSGMVHIKRQSATISVPLTIRNNRIYCGSRHKTVNARPHEGYLVQYTGEDSAWLYDMALVERFPLDCLCRIRIIRLRLTPPSFNDKARVYRNTGIHKKLNG